MKHDDFDTFRFFCVVFKELSEGVPSKLDNAVPNASTWILLPFQEAGLHRKEVIQPHLPIRLPCYDFTPVTNPALGRCSLTVSSRTSGVVDFHGVTGGVYKARERIHRSMLTCDY